MIEFLRNWIINIVTLVMVIVLLEILIPAGSVKKFINLVSGFILIIAIINPMFALFRKGIDINDIYVSDSNFLDKKAVETSSKVLEEKQMKQIVQSYRRKLATQVEDNIRKMEGIGDVTADIAINEDYTSESFGQVNSVCVKLTLKEDTGKAKPVVKIDKIRVDRIDIKKDNGTPDVEEEPISEDLRGKIEDKVSKMLEITRDNIVVLSQTG